MIPKLFHHVWVANDRPLSQRNAENIKTWQHHHPDWVFQMWGDADLPALGPLETYYRQASSPAMKADILRLEFVRRFGGVYIDVDFGCRRPIDPLLLDCDAFAVSVNQGAASAIFGARPHHPFLEELIDSVPQWFNASDPLWAPKMFGIAKQREDVRIFERKLFLPVPLDSNPKAYAMHFYDKSWSRGLRGY